MDEPLIDRRHIAIHEAGHIVVSYVFGFPLGHVTIKPDDDSAGHTIVPDQWAILDEWWGQDKWHRVEDTAIRARIIAVMAGAVAEEVCLGFCEVGDDSDRYSIITMLDSLGIADDRLPAWEARLRRHCGRVLRCHRPKIERVADALMAKDHLSPEEITRLFQGKGG
jgi:ATP-dependent Zn protease